MDNGQSGGVVVPTRAGRPTAQAPTGLGDTATIANAQCAHWPSRQNAKPTLDNGFPVMRCAITGEHPDRCVGPRPRLLDMFCCAGGAGMGYHQAGFDVVGVDIAHQRRYPFEFIQADVMSLDPAFLASFDAIHASPPCQQYSGAQRIRKNEHPDLIGPVREMLIASGKPYVIENVMGAPLRQPTMLCGGMFPDLKVYRHRLFETSFPMWAPDHRPHIAPQIKMGRPIRQGDFIHVVGNFSGVAYAREAMGIDWMSRDELREAIPPTFTKWIGEQLLARVKQRLAA